MVAGVVALGEFVVTVEVESLDTVISNFHPGVVGALPPLTDGEDAALAAAEGRADVVSCLVEKHVWEWVRADGATGGASRARTIASSGDVGC
jgi:hypothetical protein